MAEVNFSGRQPQPPAKCQGAGAENAGAQRPHDEQTRSWRHFGFLHQRARAWYQVAEYRSPTHARAGRMRIKTSEGCFSIPDHGKWRRPVPVAVNSDSRLRSSFTRKTGDRSVNYYFPVGGEVGVLYLGIDGMDSLVIGRKFGAASPVKSSTIPRGIRTALQY